MADPRILTRDEVEDCITFTAGNPAEMLMIRAGDWHALAASHEALRGRVEELERKLDELLDDTLVLMDQHVSPEVELEARRRIIERHAAVPPERQVS